MTDPTTKEIETRIPSLDGNRPDASLDEPLSGKNDPGGAHAKGFSADPRPDKPVKDNDPLPLAAGHDEGSAVRQPERDGKVRPTGRAEPRDDTPNDRLMGSDRWGADR
jgi:hypothetical protein